MLSLVHHRCARASERSAGLPWALPLLLVVVLGLSSSAAVGAETGKAPLSTLLKPDGSLDLTGPESGSENVYWDDQFSLLGVNGAVNAAAVDASGNLYIGGSFTMAGSATANRIARWDGTSWSALGSGMNDVVYCLTVSGGDLYAGGSFTNAGGTTVNRIARWDGSSWSALDSGTSNTVRALAVSGSDLYAGGLFTNAGGVPANYIARWNGSSWSALGSGTSDVVYALAVSGSSLYAGGYFTNAGGVFASRVARWNGSSWSGLGSGTNGPGVWALAVSGSDLYAGGYFTSAGGLVANYIAKWNGSSWSKLGSGMNSPVSALAVSGSDLYAGGNFATAGGVSANRIARWNGSSWSALGSGMTGTAVSALALIGNDLYAGGNFTTAGGKTSTYFAQWQPRVDVSASTLTASPGEWSCGNSSQGFYKPALMTMAGTTVSYSGGLPTPVTLDRAEEIQVQGHRVQGAFTLGPEGVEFGGTGATLRIEFSEDDVALFGASSYTDFRAARLSYPPDYPASKEAATRTILAGQSAPTPVRVENGRQIYAITAPISQISSTYGALPLSLAPVTLSGFHAE